MGVFCFVILWLGWWFLFVCACGCYQCLLDCVGDCAAVWCSNVCVCWVFVVGLVMPDTGFMCLCWR